MKAFEARLNSPIELCCAGGRIWGLAMLSATPHSDHLPRIRRCLKFRTAIVEMALMEQLPVLPALGVEHGLKFKVEDVSSIVD